MNRFSMTRSLLAALLLLAGLNAHATPSEDDFCKRHIRFL